MRKGILNPFMWCEGNSSIAMCRTVHRKGHIDVSQHVVSIWTRSYFYLFIFLIVLWSSGAVHHLVKDQYVFKIKKKIRIMFLFCSRSLHSHGHRSTLFPVSERLPLTQNSEKGLKAASHYLFFLYWPQNLDLMS